MSSHGVAKRWGLQIRRARHAKNVQKNVTSLAVTAPTRVRRERMTDAIGPIASGFTASLTAAFAPTHLEVINESSNHNVKPGSESHFKVVVVSATFAGMPPLERHRAVNDAVSADGPLPVGLPATRPAVYSGHFSFDWCKVQQFCFLAGRAVSGRGELGV